MSILTRSRSLAVLFLVLAFAVGSVGFAMVTSKRSVAEPADDLTVLRFSSKGDAFVASNARERNFGDAMRIVARNTQDLRKVSYLKFQVPWSAVDGAQVVSARLVLTPRDRVASQVFVREVTDDSWSEGTLTYKTSPARGARVGAVDSGGPARRVVDVSESVSKPGTYSFALTTESRRTRFFSGESPDGPKLLVTVRAVDDGTSGSGTRECRERFPGQPCGGEMYYGATVKGGDPRALESQTGRTLSVHRWYMTENNKASAFASRASADLAANRISLISTKTPGTWAAVAAGKYDGWLLDRIRALASVKGPAWLALHHEPRGDGPAADWVDMQQHARKLIDRYSDNISLVGILNGWDFLERGGNPGAFNHPVGSGVHIMGFDSYNPWSPTNDKSWKSVETTMSPGLVIQRWGYPTLVAETGVRTDPSRPGRAAQWLRDQYDYGLRHGFLSISYFHSDYQSPDGTWELGGERLTQFRSNLGRTETARVKG